MVLEAQALLQPQAEVLTCLLPLPRLPAPQRARAAPTGPLCAHALSLYVRWHSASGAVRINRLPLDPIGGVEELRGLSRRLIRGAFPPGGLPDYLASPAYYKFSPAQVNKGGRRAAWVWLGWWGGSCRQCLGLALWGAGSRRGAPRRSGRRRLGRVPHVPHVPAPTPAALPSSRPA